MPSRVPMIHFVLGLAVAWILVAPPLRAVPPTPNAKPAAPSVRDSSRALFAELPAILPQAGIPGLSIAVVEMDETPLVAAFGVRKTPNGPAVEPGTVFEAASLTKPLFAYGVLQLVEEGRLDLDRPLTQYVDFPDVEDDERVHRITARIVLSHTTGFPNWRQSHPLSIGPDPGTEFGYSGEGFEFLRKAVEQVTGMRMDAFIGRRVLAPLGMKSSYLIWDESLTPITATGHDFAGSAREKWKPATPSAASTLHTTAGDYARFLREIMNPTLVAPRLVEEMLTPQSNVADGVFWGLGWGLEESSLADGSTDKLFWHWGSNGYFKCFTMASPARGVALVFLTNSENGLSITAHVVRRIFGGAHPALAWRAWSEYDSPAFRIRQALASVGIERGGDGIRFTYETLRKTYGPENFDESMMNRLGYSLLRMNADAAVAVFALNADNYPDSWNAFDSLGEGLAALGRKSEAINAYEKSLRLNPDNTNGREMLQKLQN